MPAHALVWKWSQPEAIRGLTRKEREMVAERTVETGSMGVIWQLVTGEGGLEEVGALGLAPSASLLASAAGAGRLAVVQHLLRQHGCPRGYMASAAAAGKGHIEVCLWLLEEGYPDANQMPLSAAVGGDTGLCEQLLAAGYLWSEYAAGIAAAGGHIGLVLQLSEEQPEQRPTNVSALLQGAAEGLSLATLQQLHAEYAAQIAAEEVADVGHDMLHRSAWAHTPDYPQKIDWLLSLGYQPRGCDVFKYADNLNQCQGPSASGAGLVARLRFLRGFHLGACTAHNLMTGKQDEPAALVIMFDEVALQLDSGTAQDVAVAVCRHGRMGSLQLLHERGWLAPQYARAAWLLRACAKQGQQATAAWLVGNLCGGGPSQHPCTAELFAGAAELSSVPLLQQLRERGCLWSASACQAAVHSGCEAVLQWLHDEGYPGPVSFGALRRGDRTRTHALGCCNGATS